MKSSGPCLPSLPTNPPAIGVSPPLPSPPPLRVPLWIRAPQLLRVKETCALRPLPPSNRPLYPFTSDERKRCLFLSLSFSVQLPAAVRTRPGRPSWRPSSPRHACSFSRYRSVSTLFSIFRERIPDFLIAIDGRPIGPDLPIRPPFLPFLSPHLHAVMYPLLVFPALSSALIPTSRGGFPRFSPY